MSGQIKPDAGGTIRAGVQEPGTVYLAAQRFSGTATVEMDLTPEEARILGRHLITLSREAGSPVTSATGTT